MYKASFQIGSRVIFVSNLDQEDGYGRIYVLVDYHFRRSAKSLNDRQL